MSKIYFEVVDDAVVKNTPLPQFGENMYKTEVVMTKEIFQECYEKWVRHKRNKSDKESPLEAIVRDWKIANPEGRKAQCHRETGISRPTINKYWKSEMVEEAESEV